MQRAAATLREEGVDAIPIQLDVTSRDSIREAADRSARDHGRIDILVNNAGVLPEATEGTKHEFANADLFKTTFDTNVLGPVAVTEAFLPLLRGSATGRVVNVSTTMGSLTDQSNPDSPFYQIIVPAYRASKAALNSVTISLAKTLADVNKEQAPLTADQAAQIVVTAATLPDNAATGTFIDQNGPVAW